MIQCGIRLNYTVDSVLGESRHNLYDILHQNYPTTVALIPGGEPPAPLAPYHPPTYVLVV